MRPRLGACHAQFGVLLEMHNRLKVVPPMSKRNSKAAKTPPDPARKELRNARTSGCGAREKLRYELHELFKSFDSPGMTTSAGLRCNRLRLLERSSDELHGSDRVWSSFQLVGSS